MNNLTSAERILWEPIVECFATGLYNVTSYSLSPSGPNSSLGNDSAAGYFIVHSSVSSTFGTTGCTYVSPPPNYVKKVFPVQILFQESVYSANGTGSFPSLDSSLPNVYTLVAGDEWGQLVLLHFTVMPSNNLPIFGDFRAASGGCAENGNPMPCTTSEFSDAFIFNCASLAATQAGCMTRVSSIAAPGYYTITVWYPEVNQRGEPAGDNCRYSVSGDSTSPFAYCFLVNATGFAIGL